MFYLFICYCNILKLNSETWAVNENQTWFLCMCILLISLKMKPVCGIKKIIIIIPGHSLVLINQFSLWKTMWPPRGHIQNLKTYGQISVPRLKQKLQWIDKNIQTIKKFISVGTEEKIILREIYISECVSD